jgi:hypothetical protein
VVAVDVRSGRYGPKSAGVVLNFHNADTLEIARFHAGKNVSLKSRILLAEELANTIGEFVQVPVRQPGYVGRGL